VNPPATHRTFRVFISAVTGELGSHRRDVARVLRRKGLEVREQEHFRQGPATLLEQLRDYIRDCDAVIVLVGEFCGAVPSNEHAAALGVVSAFTSYSKATSQARASFTQWEYLLAKHFGKPTYVFLTQPGFTPDRPNTEDASLSGCQAVYRRWIGSVGEHWDSLTSPAKLIEDVLVLDLLDLGRPKPVVLPYPSLGELFKGRDEWLSRLDESLRRAVPGGATAIVGRVVHGLGGVGKTRLAVEYAWRHVDDHTALLFVTAETPEALQRNLAALCGDAALDLPEQAVAQEDVRLAACLHWLRENPGWLLILDNIDAAAAAEAAEKLLGQLRGGKVLLTGRLSSWSGSVEALELDILADDDGVDFLLARTAGRRRVTPQDATQARELVRELGGLALALEQAGAYIAQRRLTFAKYLQAWRERHDALIEWFDERLMQYPRSLAVTWQTSVDQLSDAARTLLDGLAWLGPEPIPESLLDVALPGATLDGSALREALMELESCSLVTRSAGSVTFTVHRLVQDVTRRSQRGPACASNLRRMLAMMNEAFVGVPWDVRNWPTLAPLALHVSELVRRADDVGITEPTASLMSRLGSLLESKALYSKAEPLMRRALAIDEASYGKDHPMVATRLNNLAQLLRATNRLAEAEPLMRRALAIDEASYGKDHPEVATDLGNLAALLKDTNRLAEAEPLMRRALAIDEASYGKDHPLVATGLNNLALLLQDTNRMAEAERLMRRALAIDEASYGKDHPTVATRLNNLAVLLQDTNWMAEAEPLIRRALAIDEASYGKDHPTVATDLSNLAALLQATNRLAEAEPLMQRALAIDEASYGKDHPLVATDLNNLALLLQDTNRLAEAEPLARRGLLILREFGHRTGHEHPNLKAALANYRAMLQSMGLPRSEIDGRLRSH